MTGPEDEKPGIFSAGPLSEREIQERVSVLPEKRKREFKKIITHALSKGFKLIAVADGLKRIEEKAEETKDPYHVGYFYKSRLLTTAAEAIYQDEQPVIGVVAKTATLIAAYISNAESEIKTKGNQNRELVYSANEKRLLEVTQGYLGQTL